MSSLLNQKPKDSYQGLLKTTDDDAIGASKKAITDGAQSSTGLGLSTTTVFANKLQIENPAASSTNTLIATLDSSGNVETRTGNSKVFDTTISDVIFAKSDGDESSPLTYLSTAETTASSLVVGNDATISTANDAVIIIGAIGDKLEVALNANIQYEQNDATVLFTINQNGSAIASSNFGNSTATSASDEIIQFSAATVLVTTADNFTVTYSQTSGATTISTGTYLKVQKYS